MRSVCIVAKRFALEQIPAQVLCKVADDAAK